MENLRDRANLKKGTYGANHGISSIAQQSSLLAVKKTDQRLNFLNELKNKQKAKNTLTLEKVKETFQATELKDDEKQKSKAAEIDEEGLIEDRDSDSDFDEKKVTTGWDDEENLDENAANEEEGEEEMSQSEAMIKDVAEYLDGSE